MTKEEAKAIFEQVKANHAKLAACKGPHNFQTYGDQNSPLRAFKKKRCELCLGELNELDVIWYERGLKHGREERK